MDRMFPHMAPALAAVQARRCWVLALAVPAVAGAAVACAGTALACAVGTAQATIALMVVSPLYLVVVGLCAVAVLAGDPLVELQGALPAGFRAVQTARAGLCAAGGMAGALALFAPLHAQGLVYGDVGWASAAAPVGGAVVMVLAAYAAAAFADGSRGVTLLVVGAWLVLAFAWDPNTLAQPAVQRGVPLAAALLVAAAAWRALGNSERALRKAVSAR